MFEHIDARSPTPLYAQISTRLRVAIAAGELQPGDALPSVRNLAGRLRVNPATVVQAYRDLEADGFVEMRQGAGTFVREVIPERRASARDKHRDSCDNSSLRRGVLASARRSCCRRSRKSWR